jgi:uncharacterized protein
MSKEPASAAIEQGGLRFNWQRYSANSKRRNARLRRIEALLQKAKALYDNGDPGHDLAHVQRVMAACERLGAREGASVEILLAAAIFHDAVNLPKNHPERLDASRLAAEKSKIFLGECGFAESEIERVATAILEHSYSLGRKPSTIESAVLQDADRLDALGAVGIMRAVACGSKMGAAFYDPLDLLAVDRSLDDKKFTIDHFFTKLFQLPRLMNTESARDEADRRVEFMRQFLSQLQSELASPQAAG